MKSINFEFLRPKWPELSGLGGFAEAYAQTDAVGAISKLRMFCEQVVEWIHFDQRLPKLYQANLNDLMANQAFKDVIPDVVLSVSKEETVREYAASTKATLQQNIAPLMQWVDIAKFEEAWKFDRLIAQLQMELIRGGGKFADLRDEVINLVSSLRINLSQVKVKLSVIERVKSDEFWHEVTVGSLEEIRDQLRGIIQFRRKDDVTPFEPVIIDVAEDESQIITKKHKVRLDKLDDLDMAAYRNRVNNVLQAIIDQNETLRKIRLGQPVTNNDLEDLCSLVLTQEPGLDLHNLMDYFQQAESLDQAIREIIGMDADSVQKRFTRFVQAHPNMASHQIKFLDLLQNHIARFGSIKTDDLYEPPFTTLHSDSLDGLFDESLADELFGIIGSFQKGTP